MTVFGMNGYYLKEMDEWNVPELISEYEKPLLILQREDDFQVFHDNDFIVWQEVLAGHIDVMLRSYPGS